MTDEPQAVVDQHRSPATIAGYAKGRRPWNYGKTFPPEPLEREDIDAFLKRCGRRGPSAHRYYALAVTLWRSGLRISEALALDMKDVNPRAGTLRVLHGKGDRARTIGMDPEGFDVLQGWLDRRATLCPARGPVFCAIADDQWGDRGRPISVSQVDQAFKRIGEKAGILRRTAPHQWRHTCAFEMIMEGLPTNLVQAQLGHSSLATTDTYVRHIAPKLLIKAMGSRTWAPKPLAVDEKIILDAAERIAAVVDFQPARVLVEETAVREIRAAIALAVGG